MEATNEQKTATCFRCAEVGAVNSRRLTTNTYVPSFEIPASLLGKALQYVAPIYRHLITSNRVLQIYRAVYMDMEEDFIEAGEKHQLGYMGAVLKDAKETMPDATKFIKKKCRGQKR